MKNLLLTLTLTFLASFSFAANKVSFYEKNGQRCVKSNGIPNHKTGKFPNSGNPNSISTQNHKFCFDKTPVKNSKPTYKRALIGIALNGIPIVPGTAEFWNNDRSSGWNLEGMANGEKLGMDFNNAHVQPTGTYHYHGVPKRLVKELTSSHIAYAADGFEIHYLGNKYKSSYQLKKGYRSSGPNGKYDGTYVQDWQYLENSGDLDECNGITLNQKYIYLTTNSYPYYPRCLFGNISEDFHKNGPPPGMRGRDRHPHQHRRKPQPY